MLGWSRSYLRIIRRSSVVVSLGRQSGPKSGRAYLAKQYSGLQNCPNVCIVVNDLHIVPQEMNEISPIFFVS